MSTKQSIIYGDGYHLYQDVMDDLHRPGPDMRPVYLEVVGSFECSANDEANVVTVRIPHRVAIALGLLPVSASERHE